jgi:ferredoxin
MMIASKNVLASDIIGSRIMDFDPFQIRHIRFAVNMNLGPRKIDEISLLGSPLEKEIIPFARATSKPLERNPVINKLKHTIRGSRLYDPACIILSTRGGSYVPRKLGLIQEKGNHQSTSQFPEVDQLVCNGCSTCRNTCPVDCISTKENIAFITEEKCIRCFCCVEICPMGAIILKS